MNGSSNAQLRPQFRRQGSSFGGAGHVTPMAVMVAPNRVDYSVTKGGLRLWAVLIVFIVLCSSLYTVFSNRESVENDELGREGDENFDFDGDIDRDNDEIIDRKRPSTISLSRGRIKTIDSNSDSADNDDDNDDSDGDDALDRPKSVHGTRATADRKVKVKEEEEEEEEEDDEKELAEREATLLASLRAKTEQNDGRDEPLKSDKTKIAKEENVRRSGRSMRLRKRLEEDMNDEEQEQQSDDADDTKAKRSGRTSFKKQTKRMTAAEEGNLAEEDEEKLDKNDDGRNDEELDKETEDKNHKEEQVDENEDVAVRGDPESHVNQSQLVNEKDQEFADEHPESGEQLEQSKHTKSKGKRKTRRVANDQPKLRCKHENCLSDEKHAPRMSLLKQIPHSIRNKRPRRASPLEVANEEDDNGELDDDDKHADDGDDDDDDDDDDNDDDSNDSDDDDDDDFNTKREADEFGESASFRSYEYAAGSIRASTIEPLGIKNRLDTRVAYKRNAITNREDQRYREQLDRADHLVEKHNFVAALEIFQKVLLHNPDSPRAHFGLARAHDIWAELESEHSHLDIAINEYQEVLDISDTPDALFRQAAYRLIDRARFRGALHRVLQAQRSLIDRYPDELQLHNDFGLTFLMMGRNDDALRVFENVLKIDANSGIAQSYYGYIMKLNGDLELGVLYMRKGLRAAREVIADPRFYFHFGDALIRLGRKQEAHRVYSIGAKVGLFLSPYQRSLYNVEGLSARPWWTIDQTTCGKHLKSIERQWTVIREEAMTLLEQHADLFTVSNKDLIIDGVWSTYYLYKNDVWNETNCVKAPKTCQIMHIFKNSSNCLKSEITFSLLTSGTRVWPHCGYTNCRLQAHLGLIVSSEARIRVADENRGWRIGKFIVFDDSFEHEYWLDGASANKYRLILKLDLWHPEIEHTRRVQFQGI